MIQLRFVSVILSLFVCNVLMSPKSNSISKKTTKIEVTEFSNSGSAIHWSYEIFEDSIVWQYKGYRNGLTLRDKINIEKEDFQNLLKELSGVIFSVRNQDEVTAVGGGGWYYTFREGTKCYLSMGNHDYLSGDYQKVRKIIENMLTSHRTEGEKVFRKIYPYFSIDRPGIIRELPLPLKKYQQIGKYR